MKRAAIYHIQNTETDDTYIGVTQYTVADRWRRHVYTAMTAPKTKLHRAIAEHGVNAFVVVHLATCLRIEDAMSVEREFIQEWQPTYNQTNGGQFTVGKKLTPEVIAKIRAGNVGKNRTAEQKAAMSELKKKQYAERPEYRAIVMASMDKARTSIDREKQKSAVSKAAKGRVWTPESRAKLSASCMGRRYSREVVERGAEKKRKPVLCITTGKIYPSILHAAEDTGIHFSSISKSCRGTRFWAGNFRFKFVS